ncbi:sensor histidine kinase [Amycolatopsis thailandensis]|uniref:sensor histidine kinase n=1 Tax=Amycolatopsis thailandensis TaxID=589330 RepID=UPI0037A01890
MTLRRRLVRTVLVLLLGGILCGAVVGFGAVRQYLVELTDDQLTASARALPEVSDGLTTGAGFWQALARNGGAPSLVQVVDPRTGAARVYLLEGEAPRSDLRPEEPSADSPDGARFQRVDGGDGQDWRLRASWLPGGEVLIVGTRLAEHDAMLRKVALLEVVVTLLVAGAVGLFVPRVIRRDLRPLDEIADTARAIGDGDLTRRVAETSPDTETGQLGLALNDMLTRLEAAFRDRELSEERLRQFIADASHELRTPVATIMGYAELFRRGAASRPDDLAKAMSRIEAEAARMGELVDELLLLARLDQGRPLEREPVDLARVVTDAIADAHAVEPDRPIEFDRAGRAVVTGDADRLRQVVANLLGNVRQHTPPGTPARVELGTEDDHVFVAVSDEGPGLTEDQRARVFERFYRAGTHRADTGGGAGLGLSIVAAVITAHDGTVAVESRPGAGATFRVRIPLSR